MSGIENDVLHLICWLLPSKFHWRDTEVNRIHWYVEKRYATINNDQNDYWLDGWDQPENGARRGPYYDEPTPALLLLRFMPNVEFFSERKPCPLVLAEESVLASVFFSSWNQITVGDDTDSVSRYAYQSRNSNTLVPHTFCGIKGTNGFARFERIINCSFRGHAKREKYQ